MKKNQKFECVISACLLGVPCRYDGKSKPNKKAIEIFNKGKALPICPEVMVGLSTPRSACEITGGDGNDVLNKKAKVIDKNENDYSKEFIVGAKRVANIIKKLGIKKAFLKSKSPSCGSGKIYNGGFSKKTKKGNGVLAALLKRNGIKVIKI